MFFLYCRGFSKEFDPCIDQIVLATLDIYKESLCNLLPTPAKCHYMFNLRDFSRVIQVTCNILLFILLLLHLQKKILIAIITQGVLLSVPETMPALSNMKRLWVHEVLRVFGDRAVDEIDINWLIQQINVTLKKHMEVSLEELFEDLLPEKGQNVKKRFYRFIN